MRIFFAAGEAGEYWDPAFDDVLVSFAAGGSRKKVPNPLWFLDSGAFSFFQAGSDGTKVLDEYIAYLLRTGHQRYASMDVIGGGPEASWVNEQKMRAAGLDPISIVHFGEPYQTIDRYLDAGITYIALGGYASGGVSIELARTWIDAIFSRIRDWMRRTGSPMPRIHGLGMTNEQMLLAYPFYSVDSTVWLIARRYGEILYWDLDRRKMGQVNPKALSDKGEIKLRYGIPLTTADGYLVPDARDHKSAWNIVMQLELADFVTDIWTKRGIVWDDEVERVRSAGVERKFLADHWPETVGRFRTWKRGVPWAMAGV